MLVCRVASSKNFVRVSVGFVYLFVYMPFQEQNEHNATECKTRETGLIGLYVFFLARDGLTLMAIACCHGDPPTCLSILPGHVRQSQCDQPQGLRMSHQDDNNRSLEHRDSHDQTIADDENRVETNFSNDDINNNVIPDDNNNDAEELEINNNNRFNESVTVAPDDVILTNRPPNPVPGPPLYLPQEPQVLQPPPPPPMPGLCPCPAIYNDPGPSYYQLPPPDYQELSPANLPMQPNLPRYHIITSLRLLLLLRTL